MNKKIILISFFISTQVFANLNFYKDLSLRELDWKKFSRSLTKQMFSDEVWPKYIAFDDKKYDLKYTFDSDLTRFARKELRRYGSDYASVVIIDNNTGKVLTAVDYTKKGRKFGKNITFSSTSPAASVFKVITAAEVLENSKVEENSLFTYNGKATTLYKYQLKNKKNRWTRRIPFVKAFARSNNVVFGKVAIQNTTTKDLISMAEKFGFNKHIIQLVDVGNSSLYDEQGEFQLAELASGFNRKTLISPIHGAVIASIVANNGLYKKPTIVSEVVDSQWNRKIWESKTNLIRVLSPETGKEMQKLMETTVKSGTARGAFRPWKMKRVPNLKIGGKTGTITGGVPYGKRDWFVSYAMPDKNNENDRGISICVMIVNVEKWYIKSTALAKNMIEYYYHRENKLITKR
jgi:cell division protein FtsI/penicillin-binding protein 2